MRGMNRVFLMGHIGHDPEPRTSPNGTVVLRLSLATPGGRKVNDTWVDAPDWHRLVAFGKDAEYLTRYARKGDSLAVECALRPNRWTDKNNQVHNEVNIVVEQVVWLQSRARPAAEAAPADPSTAAPVSPSLEDEIPF